MVPWYHMGNIDLVLRYYGQGYINIDIMTDQLDGVIVYNSIFDSTECNQWFERLMVELSWEQKMWGRRPLPRLTCHYRSGTSQTMEEIIRLMEVNFGIKIVSVFCNRYDNGSHYTPLHSDNYNCNLYTLSLGGERRFYFQHNTTKKIHPFVLKNGDVIYFNQEINNNYKHTIPKTTLSVKPRISLLFFAE